MLKLSCTSNSIQSSSVASLLALAVVATSISFSTPAFAQTQAQSGDQTQTQDRDPTQDQEGDQDRDQDRDRDRLDDADMDRIRDMLRDGSCQDTAAVNPADVETAVQCLDRDRLRDGSCTDTVKIDGTPLELLLLKCLDDSDS